MKIRNPNQSVTIQGLLTPHYLDKFWAYMKMKIMSESELIKECWKEKWDKMSEKEKNEIDKYLQRNPSPRMERANKMKCE